MSDRSKIIEAWQDVEGINPTTVLRNLAALKADLEAKGCQVTITVEGQEIVGEGENERAGDGTRTHDILLGKKQISQADGGEIE